VSAWTAAEFKEAEFGFYRTEWSRRDLGREHRDLLALVLKMSWRGESRFGHQECVHVPDAPEFFEQAVRDKSSCRKRLKELLAARILLIEKPDFYYINPDFDAWLPIVILGKRQRKSLKLKRPERYDEGPTDKPTNMQYGELPHIDVFNREFYLAKIAGRFSNNLSAEAGASRVAGRQPDVTGHSGQGSELDANRAASKSGPSKIPPPSVGTHSISPTLPPPGRRYSGLINAVIDGKLTEAEALRRLPKNEFANRAASPPNLSAAQLAMQQGKLSGEDYGGHKPSLQDDAAARAFVWLTKVDRASALSNLRVGAQWKLACREETDFVLNVCPKMLAAFEAELRAEKKPPPRNPIGYLAVKALDAGRLFSLDSARVAAELAKDAVGNLPTAGRSGG
jgi:hypothetical protein